MQRQLKDEHHILDNMVADYLEQEPYYNATYYWKIYADILMPEIKSYGLRDFKRRRKSILSSFAATDFLDIDLESVSIQYNNEICGYFYHQTKRKFDKILFDMKSSAVLDIGKPVGLTIFESGQHNITQLQYAKIIADAAIHIDFSPKMIFCEIGSGIGRVPEILANQFCDATFILFDIPPQLYVQNQYLKEVFWKRVITYNETLNLQFNDELVNNINGKIVIAPTFLLHRFASTIDADIFWNSASFQEMEPNIVLNYLNEVKVLNPKYIYINALPQGNYWGNNNQCREKHLLVTECYYFEALKSKYSLSCRYSTDYFLRCAGYDSYIFSKI